MTCVGCKWVPSRKGAQAGYDSDKICHQCPNSPKSNKKADNLNLQKGKPKISSKHKNVKTGGFDSGREAKRGQVLSLMQKSGEISDLKCQVPFYLVDAVVLDGRKKPAIKYIADFVYIRDGKQVIEDAKSPHLRKNPVYRLKKHLMKAILGYDIVET